MPSNCQNNNNLMLIGLEYMYFAEFFELICIIGRASDSKV